MRRSILFQQIGTHVEDPSGIRLHRARKLPRYIHPFAVTDLVCYVAESPPLLESMRSRRDLSLRCEHPVPHRELWGLTFIFRILGLSSRGKAEGGVFAPTKLADLARPIVLSRPLFYYSARTLINRSSAFLRDQAEVALL